ncbi:hypothetical protein PM082_023755 [Marasmius tenuissimus]|nr:hypothetical protein PM082_023755 [Marasmius tenuissimus]
MARQASPVRTIPQFAYSSMSSSPINENLQDGIDGEEEEMETVMLSPAESYRLYEMEKRRAAQKLQALQDEIDDDDDKEDDENEDEEDDEIEDENENENETDECCAQMIADVIAASLRADAAAAGSDTLDDSMDSEPTATAEPDPLPTPTPAQTAEDPEPVFGPDLGPEETGTRPMYTGRDPWLGTKVWVIGSFSKACSGTVRGVHIDWGLLGMIIDMTPEADLSDVKSGLLLDIELNVVRDGRAQPIERIDYRHVVEENSLLRLNRWRPLDHHHEVWYLRPDLPDPEVRLRRFDALPINLDSIPRSRGDTPPPQTHPTMRDCHDVWNPLSELAPTERDHWILHPKLVGLQIQVRIVGGPHDSGDKNVYVKPVSRTRGVEVEYKPGKGRLAVTHTIPHHRIARSLEAIKASTETSLMVVMAGSSADIGKLVRRISTLYIGEQKAENEWIVGGVIEREKSKETLTDERVELQPHLQVVRVKESAQQKATAKQYMHAAREEAWIRFAHRPEVRPYATST